METKVYKLKAITNLHVGSGDLSYGIVDKLVQKDSVTGFPTVNSSGIKGSLKEHLENYPDSNKTESKKKELIEKIFGIDSQPGENKFFSAHLLTYPVRSNVKPFFKATCPAILNQLIESLSLFGVEKSNIGPIESLRNKCIENFSTNSASDFIIFQKYISGMIIEDYSRQLNDIGFDYSEILVKLFGEKDEIVVVRDSVFIEICRDLPIVARNNLDEKSRNLWYEEYVPRQTEFWFFHLYSETDAIKEVMRIETLIQIGANASIGEGYCHIKELFNN